MSDSAVISLKCSEVEISDCGFTGHYGDRLVVDIPRAQIRQISLRYDTDARNPFCQYFLGFTFLSLGIIGLLVSFFAGFHEGALAKDEPGTFVIPLVPIALWIMVGAGFWLLMGIFRARYHLWIDTEEGIRRIFFDKTLDVIEIRQLMRKAHLNFGYEIDLSILEKHHPSS